MDHLSLLHISEWFQHTFVYTVKSSGGVVHGVDEIVFLAGTLSARPYIAAHGKYTLKQRDGNKLFYDAGEYYFEVSLCSRALHMSTITALAHSDAYILQGSYFSDSVAKSPGCIIPVVKHALTFPDRLWQASRRRFLAHDDCQEICLRRVYFPSS